MEKNNFLFPCLSASDECLPIESRETKVIFCNKILLRLHYLLYNIFNSWNSIRPLLSSRIMWNEYICLINITKIGFSWQFLISLASPLRQIVSPSSNINRTMVPPYTWQTKNYHMVYIWSLTQHKNCTILLVLACTVLWEHTISCAGFLIGHITALKYNTLHRKVSRLILKSRSVIPQQFINFTT